MGGQRCGQFNCCRASTARSYARVSTTYALAAAAATGAGSAARWWPLSSSCVSSTAGPIRPCPDDDNVD